MSYLCAGIITSNVLNLFADSDERLTEWDFVPGGKPENLEEEEVDWTEANIAKAQLFAAQWNALQGVSNG